MPVNITTDEWKEKVKQETQMPFFPFIQTKFVDGDLGLGLETTGEPRICGTMELRLEGSYPDLYYVPRLGVTNAPALSGGIVEVEAGVDSYSRLLEALRWLYAQFWRYKIWEEGRCPCDYCSGRGTTGLGEGGPPCSHCDGKGKR